MIAGSLDLYKESKKRRYHNEISHDYYVPVSIVVPAYNEEVTVVVHGEVPAHDGLQAV